MKLPILSNIQHLSPTSLKEFDGCNYKFYLKRLAGNKWPEFVQSKAAAVGSAFDCFVKHEIACRLGKGNDPTYNLDALIASSVEPQNRHEPLVTGKELFTEYVASGCLNRLMDEGMYHINLAKKEKIILDDECHPVLYGLPDGAFVDGRIVDFKVNGALSKTGTSPNKGYSKAYRGRVSIGTHHEYLQPLEFLNEEWATQLAIYTWLYSGLYPLREIPVAIEQVAVRVGTVTFASFRNTISIVFQQQLIDRIRRCWQAAESGEIGDPAPTQGRCHAYGVTCEVSDRCEAYQKIFGKDSGTNPYSELMR